MAKREKVSSGISAVLVQGLFMLTVVPFFLLLIYLLILTLIKNSSPENLFFAATVLGLIYLVIRHVFSFIDLYIEENAIITERLWQQKKRGFNDYKRIDKAVVFPYTFYIEFKDGKSYYFQISLRDSIRYTFSSDPDLVLKELRKKFKNPVMAAKATS